MEHTAKEELLTFFSISLAIVAASVLIYMYQNPSINGNAVINNPATIASGVISILLLAGIMLVVGAVTVVHRSRKETDDHKKALLDKEDYGDEKMKQELAHYIFQARKKGFTDEEIKERLLKNKWSEAELDLIKAKAQKAKTDASSTRIKKAIAKYIVGAKQKGFSDKQIVERLLKEKWDLHDLEWFLK